MIWVALIPLSADITLIKGTPQLFVLVSFCAWAKAVARLQFRLHMYLSGAC